jgi:hypothetical protein
MNQLKFKLTPGYITGLTQTDGCFSPRRGVVL